jgi:hypothetical protein
VVEGLGVPGYSFSVLTSLEARASTSIPPEPHMQSSHRPHMQSSHHSTWHIRIVPHSTRLTHCTSHSDRYVDLLYVRYMHVSRHVFV